MFRLTFFISKGFAFRYKNTFLLVLSSPRISPSVSQYKFFVNLLAHRDFSACLSAAWLIFAESWTAPLWTGGGSFSRHAALAPSQLHIYIDMRPDLASLIATRAACNKALVALFTLKLSTFQQFHRCVKKRKIITWKSLLEFLERRLVTKCTLNTLKIL